jgi:hypothetical protein
MSHMSKRLEKALEAVKSWPADRQDAAAELLEHMDKLARAPHRLTDDERADLEEALAEARRGEFASDAEVAAIYTRHGL